MSLNVLSHITGLRSDLFQLLDLSAFRAFSHLTELPNDFLLLQVLGLPGYCVTILGQGVLMIHSGPPPGVYD